MSILTKIRGILTPSAYHGREQSPPFFEGWYFKMVSADRKRAYTVIPGVYRAREAGKSHAFIQVMDGNSGRSSYHSYPLEAFEAAENLFDVRIGPNRFSAEELRLQIRDEEGSVEGQVQHHGITPWPVTVISPGIMGWYAWTPLMECYHGVVSLDHELQGELALDGQPVDFTGGSGYIEKDWGRSFPQAWVWLQSNHFSRPGTCITASIAIIPWVRRAFNGFIIGLLCAGELYRFATYTGAKVERLQVNDERVDWAVRDRQHRLEMTAYRTEGGTLRAPTTGEMDRRIAETLNSRVEVRLYETAGGQERLIFEDTGQRAGLEAVGDMERLVVQSQ